MEVKREPVLQKRSKNLKRSIPNANRWELPIGLDKTNIDALIGQAVGDLPREDSSCDNCAQLDGGFANCIRVPGIVECADCHWDSQKHGCSERPQALYFGDEVLNPQQTPSQDTNKKALEQDLDGSHVAGKRAKHIQEVEKTVDENMSEEWDLGPDTTANTAISLWAQLCHPSVLA